MSPSKIIFLLGIISLTKTDVGEFDYNDQGSDWPEDFPTCGEDRQSPINIETVSSFSCAEKGITIIFKEDSITTSLSDKDSAFKTSGDMATLYLRIGEEDELKYNLLQFHVHAPSEHQIDGSNFDAEVHFVFILDEAYEGKTTDILTVVGVFFEVGTSSSKFFEDWDIDANNEGYNFRMNLMSIAESMETTLDSYNHYLGSLTTPGCDEIVNWFVFRDPVSMSQEQKDLLDSFYTEDNSFAIGNGNNREVQDLNDRVVGSGNLTQCTGLTRIHKRMNFGFIKNRARSLKFWMRLWNFRQRFSN